MAETLTTPENLVLSPPKGVAENLAWRKRVLTGVSGKPDLQAALIERMAADDRLFINLCGWLQEPRATGDKPRIIPFVTWPIQDECLEWMGECVSEQHDGLLDKSRDMGATWLCLYKFLHGWLFFPATIYLLMSRNADLVYDRASHKALFSKVEFAIKRLPSWLKPPYTYTEMNMRNDSNGARFEGEPATGDMGRQARATAALLDEFAAFDRQNPGSGRRARAATGDVTGCRIINSTQLGVNNEFWRWKEEGNISVFVLDWKDHPEKGKDLYRKEDGTWSSPARDREVARQRPEIIAQEWDRDAQAAGGVYFDHHVLDGIEKTDVMRPLHVGEILYETNENRRVLRRSVRWAEGAGRRRVKLWMNLGPQGRVVRDRYFVLAGDIGEGQGASNSALSGGDCMEKRKVMEFLDANMTPAELAEYFVALCYWMAGADEEGAYGIWEANGLGLLFGRNVLRTHGYENIYWRRDETREDARESSKAGWWSGTEQKKLLFGAYREGLRGADVHIHSIRSVESARNYMKDDRGVPVATEVADRSTGAREEHGDVVVADVLMFHAMKERGAVEPEDVDPPPYTFAWREKVLDRKLVTADGL